MFHVNVAFIDAIVDIGKPGVSILMEAPIG